MLKIKVELAHPLATPETVAAKHRVPTTNEVRLFFTLINYVIIAQQLTFEGFRSVNSIKCFQDI